MEIYEMSGKQKLEKLGFNSNEFWIDVDLIENALNFDYTEENLKNNVYLILRKLKLKYGFNIPINMFGVDIVRLDNVLISALINKGVA